MAKNLYVIQTEKGAVYIGADTAREAHIVVDTYPAEFPKAKRKTLQQVNPKAVDRNMCVHSMGTTEDQTCVERAENYRYRM